MKKYDRVHIIKVIYFHIFFNSINKIWRILGVSEKNSYVRKSEGRFCCSIIFTNVITSDKTTDMCLEKETWWSDSFNRKISPQRLIVFFLWMIYYRKHIKTSKKTINRNSILSRHKNLTNDLSQFVRLNYLMYNRNS